tara:strand:+ start:48 stop:851 length:804 start_codon:yes stop_codon:yes gene_type:complete
MKKILKNLLPANLYSKFSIVYHAIKARSLKYLFYNIEKDLKQNEKNFMELGLDKDKIINVLKNHNYDYYNPKLSWHYHIFAGLSIKLQNPKILEIGTHKASTTKFISNIFPSGEIYSCDLADDELFKITYGNLKSLGKDPSFVKNFVAERNKNLEQKNIKFYSLNSFNLLEKFEKNYFDIIWLDGDHLNPQVTMDVISAFYLLKKNGILMQDDIFLDKKDRASYQSDGYEPIDYLDKIKKAKTLYFIKRIRRSNSYIKKHISYSVKN